MQKRFFIIILFVFGCWHHGFAQQNEKDKKAAEARIESYFKESAKFFKASDFPNALSYNLLALKESEALKDSIKIYKALSRIGIIHQKTQNFELAENYVNAAMELAKAINKPSAVSDCYSWLGNIALSKEDYTKALTLLNQALKIKTSLKDTAGMAQCYPSIGYAHTGLNDIAKAVYYDELALALYEKQTDTSDIIMGLVNVSDDYVKLNRNDKAISSLKRALRLSGNVAPDLKQSLYGQLSDVYTAAGNFERALFWNKAFTSLKDSLFNLSSKEKISELESKYTFEKKQKEIIQLTANNQKNEILLTESRVKLGNRSFMLVVILIVLIIISFFGYLLYRQYRLKEKINLSLVSKNAEISEQKTRIESNLIYTQKLQEALKNDLNYYMQMALSKQMNPHFIFNSLNSIQNYILKNDKLSANIYLSKFADLMRKVLKNSHHEYITIKDELNTLELYVELEQKRFTDKFEFRISIDKDLNPGYFLIPPLILQPYLENAIWHGLMHIEENRILELAITKQDANIRFSISDNGIGRDAAAKRRLLAPASHESLGTGITAKRLELISSLNKADMLVNYTDLKDEQENATGTIVTITIPAMSAFKTKNDMISNNP